MALPLSASHPRSDVSSPLLSAPLFGRERELEDVVALIQRQSTRLVTITGPGGVGKTRLAIAVAGDVGDRFDQVLQAELASLRDWRQVIPAIGQQLQMGGHGDNRLAARISSALGDQSVLLLLDNFEHIIEAAQPLSELAAVCPSITMLVTSRRPLHLSIEREYQLAPFTPVAADASITQIDQSPAVSLFRHHGSLLDVSDSSAGNEAESRCIASLCASLDGLPLAIELAAAQTRIMTPCDLLSRLNTRLRWLESGRRDAPIRFRTMRRAIGWSVDLLDEFEHRLFMNLSVFSGGFSLDAAIAAATWSSANSANIDESGQAITALGALLDHGLVHRVESQTGSTRFSILETIREHGLEQLVASGIDDHVRTCHMQWFASLEPFPNPEDWTKPFGSRSFAFAGDADNLRSALERAFAIEDMAASSQVIWMLSPYWRAEGLVSEARSAIDRVLSAAEQLDPYLRAGLVTKASELAWFQTDPTTALARAMESLELYETLDFRPGIAASYHELGSVHKCLDNALSAHYYQKAMEEFAAVGNERAEIWSLQNLGRAYLGVNQHSHAKSTFEAGFVRVQSLAERNLLSVQNDSLAGWAWFGRAWIAHLEGRHIEAVPAAETSLAIFISADDRYGEQTANRLLGRIARINGRLRSASQHMRRAFYLSRLLGTLHCEMYCLAEIAAIATLLDEPRRAAMLLGAERAIAEPLRLHLLPDEQGVLDLATSDARTALGVQCFESPFLQGRSLGATEVFQLAMSILELGARPAQNDGALSPRERDVVALIAEGRTNREIAESLFVSKRTVDGHVVSILSKLGASSRREAANTAREQGIVPQ